MPHAGQARAFRPTASSSDTARFDQPHVITRAPESELDVLGDLRQRGVVPGGKAQVLRWAVQDLMCSQCVSSGQQQAVPLKDRRPAPAIPGTGTRSS